MLPRECMWLAGSWRLVVLLAAKYGEGSLYLFYPYLQPSIILSMLYAQI
jgi:hypothetical protein